METCRRHRFSLLDGCLLELKDESALLHKPSVSVTTETGHSDPALAVLANRSFASHRKTCRIQDEKELAGLMRHITVDDPGESRRPLATANEVDFYVPSLLSHLWKHHHFRHEYITIFAKQEAVAANVSMHASHVPSISQGSKPRTKSEAVK